MRPLFEMILAVAAVVAPAAAATGPLLVESSVLTEHKQTAADGSVKVSLTPANRVVPGDKVVFVLSYRNVGAQPIDDVVLSNPLPKGIAYRAPNPGSSVPELSVDGQTYGPLPTLHVAGADGTQRAATADDVTHVRWRLSAPLPAGAKGQFSFQAILK